MDKLKVFISIPWFLPAFRAGGPVQSVANMVNQLNEGYLFYIFCGDTDLNGEPNAGVEPGKWILYNAHTRVWYASKKDRRRVIKEQVAMIKPSILFSIGIFSWPFNMVPLLFTGVQHKIVSARGMLHPGALQQKKWKKKIFLLCWKLSGLHKQVSFHATDETEAKHIRTVFGNEVKVAVADNFPKMFVPGPVLKKEKGELVLLSIALIGPMKNHLLVLQALEQCSGNIVYHIIGPVKDKEYWERCREQISRLPSNIEIIYHGEAEPKLLQEYFNMAHVFILPSISENYGHALAEALTAGKPVITSYHTPWLGLEKESAGLNIENETESVKKAISLFLHMEDDEYVKWCKGAEQYAKHAIDLSLVRNQYKELFKAKSV